MNLVKTVVKESKIHGKGVFADENIKKGAVVWKFVEGFDISETPEEYAKRPQEELDHLYHTSYLSPWTGMRVSPPIGDSSDYTNHSFDNNTSVKYDRDFSPEPFFCG